MNSNKKKSSDKTTVLNEKNNLTISADNIERLQAFFKNSTDGFFFMSLDKPINWNEKSEKEKELEIFFYDLKITELNKAFLDQYGGTENDLLGFSPSDFFKHNKEYGLSICKKILDSGFATIISDERKIDGSTIWVECSYFLYKNKKEQILGLFGIQRDISNKKKNEEDLNHLGNKYKSFFNDNLHHIFILDAETLHILSVNESASEFYGYSESEFLQLTLKEVTSKESCGKIDALVNSINNGDASAYAHDVRQIKKDSSEFFIDIRIRNILHENKRALLAVTTDITESKRLQENLRQSEESFRGLFNSVTNAIYIQDKFGKFLDVNKGAEKMYGYDRKDFIGRTPEFLSAPDLNDIEQIENYIASTYNGNGPSTFEFWGKRKNGDIFPKQVSVTKGTYFGEEVLIAISTDITDRKNYEQTLSISESNFRTLFRNISDAILIHDMYGNIVEANERAMELYEISYHQLVSINVKDLSADTANQFQKLPTIWDSVQRNSSTTFEWKAKKPLSGFIFDVEVSLRKSVWSNKEVIIAIVRNITEKKRFEINLKESEERFRRIYEDAPIGIYRSTRDGRVIIANPVLVKMLGYNNFEEMRYLNIEENFFPSEYPRKDFINEIDLKGSIIGKEYHLKRKDGSEIDIRESARVVKDEKGKVLYYEGTIEDISERKIAEKMLVESEKKLREINSTKDKFFSIIAHDLKSPFQGLLGIASILVEENDLTLQDRIVLEQRLHEGLKNQYSLLDDLLTWSRLQRGVMEFKYEQNNVYNDLQELLFAVKASAEKKNLILNVICSESFSMNYDRNMFTAIVRNFVSNAIKFTPEFGTITIKASSTDRELIVSVIDSGVGVAKEDLPKLFRIDTHFVRRGTNDESGSGLGLILCKEFIEKHEGKFWVESTLNLGSTFSFSIPKQLMKAK